MGVGAGELDINVILVSEFVDLNNKRKRRKNKYSYRDDVYV